MDFLRPFLGTAITAVTVIAYKTVAPLCQSCQLTTFNCLCFYEASVLLNNLLRVTSLISLMGLLFCLLLMAWVNIEYSMSGHTVQEGAV